MSNDDNEVNMETLKKDLQKSFSPFEKSIEKKGLNISNINPDSLYWDHEGVDAEDLAVCTHVLEGQEDEQLLENLKALEPCGEFDDDAFPKRVQDSPKNTGGESETDDNDAQPPEFQPKYSGVAGRATARFKDLLSH